jgi:hypothetical protein
VIELGKKRPGIINGSDQRSYRPQYDKRNCFKDKKHVDVYNVQAGMKAKMYGNFAVK